MADPFDTPLTPYVDGAIWLARYPMRFGGIDYYARMTVVRLADGRLWIHSPAPVDGPMGRRRVEELRALGEVAYLVAPGNFHHLHVEPWRRAFPGAEVYACPGVERKQPRLAIDWFLGDRAPPVWADELDQVLIRGNRVIWEVAFLHRASGTLILTDVLENIRRDEPGLGRALRWLWMGVFRLWREPMPAPEYKIGWSDRPAAARSLERILAWRFSRVVIAHGDTIEADAEAVLRRAWASVLRRGAQG
ncbi:MAG: DUF4336 domain-containing protein [Myxococcales bacterium]|nr:DUF4336 domain-containing protein [Myxococcales bacterium]